ncbi:uncharacterized protein LOC133018922 [Limanda limanda]|uniref:uncharacterized protein LOC133015729 n=1 Tax=Limanda limanda TaxID=27771 RepID=UPI0029C8EFB4|nr:uncharacterized protein LOC133015729 [Limanda limanda]XP_060938992.1 uncharacterized protein LOC133015738 [Limanda limanda]XP_060941237.1 uncharacterized protein LOC133018922 [Limanda limanda]
MTSLWKKFDDDVDQILEAMAKGEADRKLRAMTTIIVSIAAERFGEEEKKSSGTSYSKNQRAVRIHNIRQEMKALKSQYKAAGQEDRIGLAQLMCILRKNIRVLRRAEWHRRRRCERARKRAAFIANPFKFTKDLLGQKRSGKLASSQEDIDQHLKQTYSDPVREQELGECNNLIEPPEPEVQFDMSELQLKEVREVVCKARASSAPGPSGTSYKVYKNCPKLLLRLWRILRVFWRRGRIPEQWRVAEGVWIPKEENSTQLDQFRIISLLCVEAKIFFSAVSKRLCTYLAKNTYIDTSVQKGGIPGMSGCVEHTGVVTQLIREARENKGNLSVLWLDLANAFGSIPHKLVQLTLRKHHVPSRCRDLIADYYSNFRMRVSSGAITSSWHKVEIGIITGCTISVTLFSLAMNMLTKSAEPECRGPRTNSGQRQPPIRAFMDDLTVMTESVPGCRWILRGLEKLVEWARMRFKPAKSRSMVLRKGKVEDKFRFNITGTAIPTITEKPVKSLGKVFDCSLRDTTSIQSTCTELDGWLKSVDKSGLPGKFKAWVYQHGILPRILWPLLVYAVPISTVETLERKVSKHLRRWLGLPRSLSSIALYGNTNKLRLPFKSLEEEFKVTRAREVVQYRDSSDPKVAKAGIQVRTGRKWRAEDAVQEADARLRHRSLVGVVTRSRAGLGSFPTPQMNTRGKERRRLVQEEVRAAVEETRTCKAVGMKQQGAWTRWENAVERKVTWAELWKAEPHRIKFLIQAVYDVLPSPSNLHIWGIAETPACPLCSKRGTLEHILSCCTRALGDGRYRWRHDQVLKTIAEAISAGLAWAKQFRPSKITIAFVRAGDKPTPARRTSSAGILTSARDWQLLVDLEHQLKFPSHIAVTTLRPDIVLVSESTKQAVLLELTVPWEDRLEEAFERKLSKYAGLVSDCQQAGWRARCFPVEVGCRGFAARSLARAFSSLGIEGERKRRAIRSTTDAAERASRWLWLKRGEPWSHGS